MSSRGLAATCQKGLNNTPSLRPLHQQKCVRQPGSLKALKDEEGFQMNSSVLPDNILAATDALRVFGSSGAIPK